MAAAVTAAGGRDAERAPAAPAAPVVVPVRGLTVLYDARCSLCTFVREWLGRQRQSVPLGFVAAGSQEARHRFPTLDHRATLQEITVVGDGGQIYQGSAAWVVCLWALREHRPLAHRLSTPAGAKLAKAAMLGAAKWRETQAANGGGSGWSGSAYYSGDGWSYDPGKGWTYTASAASAAAPLRPSAPAPPDGCESGTCPTG